MVQKTDQTAIKIARDYALVVKNHGIPVDQAYLFGSRAYGNARKDSDYDVCIVVSKPFKEDRWDEAVELQKLTHYSSECIEPHLMYISDMDDKYDPLVYEVKSHGIPVL